MHLPEGLSPQFASIWDDLLTQVTTTAQPGPRLLVAVEPPSLRDACLEALAAATPDQVHAVLDLSGEPVTSLAGTLAEKLGALPATPAGHMLHILHAEASILHGWLEQAPVWVDQLAAEAEGLTQSPASTLVFWTDAFAAGELATRAPELWAGTWRLLPQDPPASLAVYDRVQALATQRQAASDPAEQAALDLAVGEALMDFALDEWALPYFQAATAGAPTTGTQAAALAGLGLIHLRAGHTEDARTALEAAQAVDAEEVPVRVRGRIASRLGDLYLQQRRYQEALPSYRDALALYEEAGEPADLLHVYRNLARTLEGLGHLEKAVATYGRLAALPGLEPAQAAATHQQIGAIRQNQQRWAEALAAFEAALPLAQAAEDDFLIHALEDSIEDMRERAARTADRPSDGDTPRKKGWLGRLFGG